MVTILAIVFWYAFEDPMAEYQESSRVGGMFEAFDMFAKPTVFVHPCFQCCTFDYFQGLKEWQSRQNMGSSKGVKKPMKNL